MKIKLNPIIPQLSVKYGAVGGILAVVAFAVFHYMGLPAGSFISFLATVIVVGMFIFLPMREFKFQNSAGFRFYHGMTIGFISYLSIATVFSLFYLLFIKVIEPDYIIEKMEFLRTNLIDQREQKIEELGLEVYERQLKGMDSVSVSADVLSEFAKRLFIGLFLAPVFSIILRTRQA
ncbi:DUF4199 domain-containing protein [Roseivirga sp.]|uniref:DUF4199 domain-containing protein n=1 Tax=Roseivirga sp. TaxID=1964215 RepID=UPI003B8CFA6B